MNVQLSIKEIMTVNIETVQQNDKIYHLPVLAAGSKLAGILSREDVYRFAYHVQKEKAVELIEISEIMTPNPMSLDIDDSIRLAADVFLANKFHAIPVTDGDELLGIVTSHDLLEYAYGGKIIHPEGR